jgi:hypothetical protein
MNRIILIVAAALSSLAAFGIGDAGARPVAQPAVSRKMPRY